MAVIYDNHSEQKLWIAPVLFWATYRWRFFKDHQCVERELRTGGVVAVELSTFLEPAEEQDGFLGYLFPEDPAGRRAYVLSELRSAAAKRYAQDETQS